MTLRKSHILLIITGMLLTGVIGSRMVSPRVQEDASWLVTHATRQNFEIRVNTVGTLDAGRSHMVSSMVRGDKGQIIFLIEDGKKVEPGDVLIRLDPTPFEAEIKHLQDEVIGLEAAAESAVQLLAWEKNQAEQEIRSAEFNHRVAGLELKKLVEGEGPLQLAQLKGEMEKAKEEYGKFGAYLDDLDSLKKKGFNNPTELLQAKNKTADLQSSFEIANQKYISYKDHVLPSLVETGKAKVEKTDMELTQIRKGSVFKIAKAESGTKEAEGKLNAARTSLLQAHDELAKTAITAPFSGIAILYEAFRDGQNRKPRVGDSVWQNQPLLYLPDISSMVVQTQIREVDLYKVSVGKPCTIRVDAYPDALFDGEISLIGVLAARRFETGFGEKFFQLTVAVQTPDPRLRPGMTARISVLAETVTDALTIPVQAVFSDKSEKYCYKPGKNALEKVVITTGRQNEDFIEILSGLDRNDPVSLVRPKNDPGS
jgi:HlyD family secretion protein